MAPEPLSLRSYTSYDICLVSARLLSTSTNPLRLSLISSPCFLELSMKLFSCSSVAFWCSSRLFMSWQSVPMSSSWNSREGLARRWHFDLRSWSKSLSTFLAWTVIELCDVVVEARDGGQLHSQSQGPTQLPDVPAGACNQAPASKPYGESHCQCNPSRVSVLR